MNVTRRSCRLLAKSAFCPPLSSETSSLRLRFLTSKTPPELPPHSKLKMPDFEEKGTILEWIKKPGDAVKTEEILVDVSFDSFDVEVVAEQNGFLAQILATPEDGGIDGGSEIGIIVKDVDFVPFFTPSFVLPGPGVDDDTEKEVEAGSRKEESSGGEISAAEGGAATATTHKGEGGDDGEARGAKEGKQQQQQQKVVEEGKAEQYSVDDKFTPTTKREAMPAATRGPRVMSGFSMLTAIKALAAEHLQKEGEPMNNEVLLALKDLAVRENETLQSCFYAAGFDGNPEGVDDNDPNSFSTADFLELSSFIVGETIKERNESKLKARQQQQKQQQQKAADLDIQEDGKPIEGEAASVPNKSQR